MSILFFTVTRKVLIGFDLKSSKMEVSTSGTSQCVAALADLKCAVFYSWSIFV